MTDEMTGDGVYQPDGVETQDGTGLLDASDTLDDRAGREVLDEGCSPADRPWGADRTGVTAAERLRGESLDERLAEEVPDIGPREGDGLGDTWDTDGELIDDEVGDLRAGRLVAADRSDPDDPETDLFASDVGLDGAGASAEEAAMHVISESGSC
ncbi:MULTISPECIES: DUF5709 domain-containing protein [Streptomyces]|uniref:DUF5709 domain-containing protein n=1 Tax=Streptomyces eurythermus TaxID=42237 RepID=A0ABW6Z3D0_9ACTN|nr:MULTISPECIES: DUF5709 domain-containing protein [Streptomyces]QIS69655.1 hypothetical protein HB370_06350 [Streptomyces sp. DSM 40868]WDM12954.1 hypothetical protein J3S85_16275 [Streptomyces lavenduligriseus]